MADVVIEKPKSFWQSLHPRRLLSLRLFGHLAALLPLALLGVDALRHKLTVNPIQYLTQQLGIDAMLLLAASLALTPLITLTGLHQLQRLSRPLGLYAFLYTTLHVLLFVGVDYGFSWTYLWEDMQGKNYFLTGILSFAILVALAATSFRWWMRKMGKAWKWLHRFVYAAGVLAVLHYGLAVKGDLFRLQGDVVKPALYGLALFFLFGLRIPPVRRAVIHARQKLLSSARRSRLLNGRI